MRVGFSEAFIRNQRSWQHWPQFCAVRMGWNEGLLFVRARSLHVQPPHCFIPDYLPHVYLWLCVWGHFICWALGSIWQHLGKGTWLVHCLGFWGMVGPQWPCSDTSGHLSPLEGCWGSGNATSMCGSTVFEGAVEAGRLFPFPLGCFSPPKATHKTFWIPKEKHPHPKAVETRRRTWTNRLSCVFC